MWCITSIIVQSKIKSWWHHFPILNTKNFKICMTTFGIQSSLWIKINLDPMIKWKGLDKINVHRIYKL